MAASLLAGCDRVGELPPVTNVADAPESAGGAVIANREDTVYTIARRYNVPLRDLIDANRLAPPYTLQPGQRLLLPAPRQYVVRSGDTLYGISRMFGVEVTELSRLNRLAAPYTVKVGQSVRLPGGGQGGAESAGPVGLVPGVKPAARGGVQAAELPPPGAAAASPKVSATSLPPPSPGGAVAGGAVAGVAVAGGGAPIPPLPPATHAAGAVGSASVAGDTVYQPGQAPQSLRLPGSKPALVEASRPPPTQMPVQASPPSPPPAAEPAPPAQVAVAPPPKAEPRGGEDAAPPPRGASRFLWPVKGKVLSNFGPKPDGMHNDGINIAATRGAQVHAADNGVVAYAGNELRGFGNLLLIRHADGWITAYAHLDRMDVARGASVKRGQVIGTVGQTGSVTSPQLHFEVRKGSHAVDPRDHLDGSQVSEAAFPAGPQGPG